MKTFIRAPLLVIISMVIIAVVTGSLCSQTAVTNSNALVLTQASTALVANRGDVIKETAYSALGSSNVTITTLTHMPSTTIKQTGENAEATFNSTMLEQDIGAATTMTQATFTTTAYGVTATTPLDVGITNGETMVNTTTATTVTANYYTDVGFVSENNNGDYAIDAQALTTNADNTGAATLQTCGTNDNTTTRTITGAVNIRGATLTLTVDRETYAIASRTMLVLQV